MTEDDLPEDLVEAMRLAEEMAAANMFNLPRSPMIPSEMIAELVAIDESIVPPAIRHQMARLISDETIRLYRNINTGNWQVWDDRTQEKCPLAEWVAQENA